MSEYEVTQVLLLIEEIGKQCGSGLDEEELKASCWLAYFEVKKCLPGYISLNFWPNVAEHMVQAVLEMRISRKI